jgi:tripartite-type tricarboxylate transporter receptor subunit TctC
MAAPINRLASIMAMLSMLVAPSIAARAEEWPSHQVRVIVPFGAGGSGDTIARVIAEGLSVKFGQKFIVENRTGAGGAIGARAIATSPADGYTIGITNLSVLSLIPVINTEASYDPIAGFSHIAYAAGAPVVLAANSQTGIKTLDQFVQYSTAHRAFTFASSGVGSDGHLMGEAIALSLNLKVEHIPYKSTSQALVDVVGGYVPFSTFTLSSTAQFMRGGQLTGIAVTSADRVADFPQVPTFKELGHPELEGTTWFSISGPAGLPAEVVSRLNAEINRIIVSPDVATRLRRDGFQERPMTPAEFSAFVASENQRWKVVVDRAGLAGRGH